MPEVSKRTRIAVDAMGGDHAPEEIVKGAIQAAQKDHVEVILVGLMDVLEKELCKYHSSGSLPLRCVAASDVIKENESPSLAIRRKSNCSIAVATKLVKAGEADAVVGAGSSGAAAVSAIHYMGMVEGMERPAICAPLSSFAPNVLLVDFGANVDCKPYQLLAFAVAGTVYARKIFNIANPAVGLLSTGSEKNKGNEVVRETYPLLEKSDLNFIGNIEGSDILSGRANVIVCDGFVGNIIIKFYESIGKYAMKWMERKVNGHPLVSSVARLSFNKIFPVNKLSYESEDMGGGILWGIDGVVRIAHGASRAPHIAHAIASASNAVETDLVGCLKSELAKLRKEGKM
ncbi:MAG: phosphate acyltransferase PlsX [Dehalococcoidia bacterium]|nr:phosphate acyltransferase PlsX [Dehalococcoidia bacterium]